MRYKELNIPTVPKISVPATTIQTTYKKEYICIGPGSGSSRKNWPLSRFIEAAVFLKNKGFSIIWIFGPAEENLSIPSDDVILKNEDLLDIAAVLSKCELYIGNDSGITHLAAASGCKTIALFGPSDPRVWSPRGPNVKVLHKPKLCTPCHLTINSQKRCNRDCILDILVDDLIAEIKNVLPYLND